MRLASRRQEKALHTYELISQIINHFIKKEN